MKKLAIYNFCSVQVRTLLENPTRYHVVQKQKNQVRQYLHESFRGNGTISAGDGNVLGRNSVEGVPTSAPMIVQSAPPGPTVHHPKPQHPHLASYPHGPTVLPLGNQVAASPDPTTGAMSPGLSSVATSNSEVIYLSNFWISILNMCPRAPASAAGSKENGRKPREFRG